MTAKFVKYHSRNLISFARFLDKKFPDWTWFNVYDTSGQQVANFTYKRRPATTLLRNGDTGYKVIVKVPCKEKI